MSQSLWIAVLAVAAVAVLGLLLRRSSTLPETGTMPPPPPTDPEIDLDVNETEDEEDAGETLAVTSDGWSFMPVGDRDRVRLVPPPVRPGTEPVLPRPSPEQLARGDLIAARVTRGAPDHDPWRLEGLGRDHEFRAWRFETEEAAQAALELVDRCIVRAPRDEDGNEIAVSHADFADARRREDEIESELATMTDIEQHPDGPPPRPLE